MMIFTRLSEFLGRFSLRIQIAFGFACLSFFVILSGIFFTSQLSKFEASSNQRSVSEEEIRAIAEDVSIDIGVWRQCEREMLLNVGAPSVFAQFRKKWSDTFPHLLEDIDTMRQVELAALGTAVRSQKWKETITHYHDAVQQVLDRIDSGGLSTLSQADFDFEYNPVILALTKMSHSEGVEAKKRVREAKGHLTHSIAVMRLVICGLGVLAAVFAASLTLVLSSLLTHRAKTLCQMVRQLSQGDFTSRVAMSGRDEFATIGQTINDMARRIEERNAELERDITRREQAEEKLQKAQQRYELAVRGSRDGLWDWDLIEDQIYYAPRWKAMLGFEDDEIKSFPEEWIGRIVSEDLGAFQHMIAEHMEGASDEFESEFRMVHKDGSVRWMLCRGAAVRNDSGRAIRLAGALADITEIKETQEALRRAAEHDRLTSLPNRTLFCERVEDAIHRCQRDPSQGYAVLFFDFDRFKVVNDSLGHSVGDELLISIAHRFEKELRVVDTAARFGGDEFVVLLTGLSDISYAHEVADRLVAVFEQPHSIGGGHQITSTASVGLVTCEGDYDAAEDVIRDADSAMYQAKIKGKCQVIVFDKAMHLDAVDRMDLEEELRHAVSDNQLLLYHQPIVNLETGQLTGFEALIRWMHPERGLIGPDKFIPIAEDTGLIVDIGIWVLRTACLQVMDWNRRFQHEYPLAINVNVSKRQLCQPDVIEVIGNVFDETHVDPSLIKIEITESVIVDNRADMIPILEKIKELGVKLAMDDFGTGQSSLSGLHKFPIDVLKIDQSFVQQMEKSREVSAVVCSIVTLAHNLNMEIVAEGVETVDQLAVLQSHGCEYGQGYYFAKPLPVAEAEKYVRRVRGDGCRARAA